VPRRYLGKSWGSGWNLFQKSLNRLIYLAKGRWCILQYSTHYSLAIEFETNEATHQLMTRNTASRIASIQHTPRTAKLNEDIFDHYEKTRFDISSPVHSRESIPTISTSGVSNMPLRKVESELYRTPHLMSGHIPTGGNHKMYMII